MKLKEKINELISQHKNSESAFGKDGDVDWKVLLDLEKDYQKQYKTLLCKVIDLQIRINDTALSDKITNELKKSKPLSVYKENKLYSSLTKLRITPQLPFDNDSQFLLYFIAPGKIKLLSSRETITFWTQLASFLNNNLN